jgi:hypothetical protein
MNVSVLLDLTLEKGVDPDKVGSAIFDFLTEFGGDVTNGIESVNGYDYRIVPE